MQTNPLIRRKKHANSINRILLFDCFSHRDLLGRNLARSQKLTIRTVKEPCLPNFR